MNIKEIERIIIQCRGQIALIPNANIGLTLRGKWGKRNYRYVLGVKGLIMHEDAYGIYCLFPAQEMLNAALKRQSQLESE